MPIVRLPFRRTRPTGRPLSVAVLATALAAAPLVAQVELDPTLLHDLGFRSVGPNRGGRVTTVTGVPSQPFTFYMGVASGGVWKTTDAGASWLPISDGQIPVGSTGALQVAPSDPDVVYLGTGSEGLRSNVSVGRGVYKSTDAGKTWSFSGLRDVGQIGAVRIHPSDPDVVFLSAVGNPFAPNPERGVFRTRDGGRNWQKVLFLADSIGASDVELQPGNPDVVYAWMARAERKPWTIISGGREGGFYKSTDAGENWTKMTDGLPSELVGKGNIGVSAADPDRVYLLVEAKPGGGLYRSDDSGQSWTQVSDYPQLITRPFYYTTLGIDPNDADVVYAGAEGFFKSTDGGKTWSPMELPHGDHHDIWINPNDSDVMVQANDGGANVSLNGGRTWSTQYNQPTSELYGVWLDDQVPYRLYAAQQDNSTLILPSLPLNSGQAEEWRVGPGCETGPIIPHPTMPDTVYGSCKGQFSRMSLRTGQEKQYWVGAESLYGNTPAELKYRFQRVSPMVVSRFDPRTIYYGSQHVHRTRDEGVTWERISPDLTANDPKLADAISGEPITRDMTGEEMYPTLYAITESPLEQGVIWTGANDGPFHVTRDGGTTWEKITPPDLPPGGRVQFIDASPHRRGSAYYAVYRYLLGDFRPYIYATRDYGKTWRLLTDGTNGIPADVPTRVVREDPEREGLLYAGTEFGLFISTDDGAHWQPFQLNLPVIPITDIKVHQDDLVLSTQGRGFWILDELGSLRQMVGSPATGVTLFEPGDAYRLRYSPGGGMGRGDGPAAPQYSRPGAIIDYWLPAGAAGPVTVEILDASGRTVRTFSSEGASGAPASRRRGAPVQLGTETGLNRFIWDMTYPGPWDPRTQGPAGNGPMAPPGTYTVRLAAGGQTATQPLVLLMDPRVERDGVTVADVSEQFEHNLRVRELVSGVNQLVEKMEAERKRLQTAGSGSAAALQRLERLRSTLVMPPIRYSSPELQDHIEYLYSLTTNADQKIGRDAVERYQELRQALDAAQREMAAITGQ